MPKNRGREFADLIEELAHDTCVEGEPDCPRCELRKICPTGHGPRAEAEAAAAAPGRQGRRAKGEGRQGQGRPNRAGRAPASCQEHRRRQSDAGARRLAYESRTATTGRSFPYIVARLVIDRMV